MDDGSDRDRSQSQPWWHESGGNLPDLDALLGADGAEAVGNVADEALKLFLVMRDKWATTGEAAAPEAPQASPWDGLIQQFGATAIKAVEGFAATVGEVRDTAVAPTSAPDQAGAAEPGESAACAYCPICQGIALFRSVPMDTWQRLAAAVVDFADSATQPDAGSQPPAAADPVVLDPKPKSTARYESVDDFLASLDFEDEDDQ